MSCKFPSPKYDAQNLQARISSSKTGTPIVLDICSTSEASDTALYLKTCSFIDKYTFDTSKNTLREVLNGVSEEIQRVLDENNFTQEDLCRITNMSQSNISKIQNGKVVPKIETLQKIAMATNTRLVISFESIEGDDQ